jgi:hypothetical protein
MLYAIAAIACLVLAFLWWRITSVARGARQRDQKIMAILEPVAEKLKAKQPLTSEEIAGLAQQPHVRPPLYELLKYFERVELFPPEYLSIQLQGEAALAYWLMHPNELQDAPDQIELVDTVVRERDDVRARFLVYRYRMPKGHWAENDGWLLGLAGPFLEPEPGYSSAAVGFARAGDQYGKVQPAELVDWYLALMERKGL